MTILTTALAGIGFLILSISVFGVYYEVLKMCFEEKDWSGLGLMLITLTISIAALFGIAWVTFRHLIFHS